MHPSRQTLVGSSAFSISKQRLLYLVIPPRARLRFVRAHQLLAGLGGGFESFPVAFHHNPRSNGTSIMTALFSILGHGIEVFQFNPYNATERARLYEVDGSYFVDLDYITNLPEGIPDALQQQTTKVMHFASPIALRVFLLSILFRFVSVLLFSPQVVGDYFYSMLSYRRVPPSCFTFCTNYTLAANDFGPLFVQPFKGAFQRWRNCSGYLSAPSFSRFFYSVDSLDIHHPPPRPPPPTSSPLTHTESLFSGCIHQHVSR